MRSPLFATFSLFVLLAAAPVAGAADLPPPSGKKMLTVSGAINHTNTADGRAQFDLAMLSGSETRQLVTSTPWTDGPQTFTGIPLARLLELVGAKGQTLHAVALNDYAVDIPASDAQRYAVLVAYTRNGAAMPVADKGPLWIVYPRDQHPELGDERHNFKWIWQLKAIEVR